MKKFSKLLLIFYITLLTTAFATPTSAVFTLTPYDDKIFKTGEYCCSSDDNVKKFDTCLQKASKIKGETPALEAKENCIEKTTCQAGACTETPTTNTLLKIGDVCDMYGNGDECETSYCSPTTSLCVVCTDPEGCSVALDIGDPCNGGGDGDECASGYCGSFTKTCAECPIPTGCFEKKGSDLLHLGEACFPDNSAECASGYCDPYFKKCSVIATPTPTGGGEPVESMTLPNFLFTEDPNDVIGRVIEFVIGLAGTAALVMFIYGGVRWLTSGGDAEGIKKGREAMQWAAIGLIIVFSSFVLVKFVLKVIGSTAGA